MQSRAALIQNARGERLALLRTLNEVATGFRALKLDTIDADLARLADQPTHSPYDMMAPAKVGAG